MYRAETVKIALKACFKHAFLLVFPIRCLACKTVLFHIHNDGLCPECWSNIHFITTTICAKCGHPIQHRYNYRNQLENYRHICNKCQLGKSDKVNYLDSIRAATLYRGTVQRLVKNFKYDRQLLLRSLFVRWIMQSAREVLNEEDVILVPVPLHRRRLRWRKFNQSAALIKEIHAINGNSYILDLLVRIVNTVPQNQVPRGEERWANIKDAFEMNKAYDISNKNIVLIDDVITTGATVNECAKVLMEQGGAKKVFAVSIAKT